jgi:segregation and condensation protein A
VELPSFEGPLDLLLFLIKKDEVDIYDIQIEKITEKYLAALDDMRELNIEIAGDFIVLAANLIYIKSRTLLPQSQQAPEEDVDEEDPRWELIRQLIEYKKFKDASFELQDFEDKQSKVFYRPEKSIEKADKVAKDQSLGKVGVIDLINAFNKVLALAEKRQGFHEVNEENFTVGDKMNFILKKIDRAPALRFFELFSNMSSRNEIVATFLAILELIRLKQIAAQQNSAFDDIEIVKVEITSIGVENYGTE